MPRPKPTRTRPTMKNQISKPVRLFTLALFHSNMNRTPANQAAKDEIPKVIISVGDASGFRQHANCVFIRHAGAHSTLTEFSRDRAKKSTQPWARIEKWLPGGGNMYIVCNE